MPIEIAANLPVLFAALVAFCVVVYVLADGFDIGVGILLLLAPRPAERDMMLASVEPTWDGNETWLVMGGVLLLATFPAGYYVLLPAFYLPIIFMLFALVMRGVAFGFRQESVDLQRVWDVVFAGGSLVAALCQGIVLGGLITGVTMRNGAFAGGTFDFLTPLGLACGLGLVGGYALLGAGWLIMKTGGQTQLFAREVAHSALILTAAMLCTVSGLSALLVPEVAARWISWPDSLWLAPAPIVTAVALVTAWRRIWTGRDGLLFLMGLVVFAMGFVGLVASLWPYVVPRHVTIWDGVADRQSLVFIGVGVACVLPVVLAYQAHAYRVFRGKVRPGQGYGAAASASEP
ncbi:cytochrome d ubiquinol oxidase subunit II [Neoroseomonas lacus]|uniref:Ubiquinol oxidase subunit II, cyanide insensitive n=1 Tax=Neoroseomonas lacus TaxID=287609 RepID=A0A917K8B8_9PROT|nr:cytochrome d ubiquinol oxidase subunit II [Neoroseomonas lacus]GGJ04793.1 ubiquinol oxidase subunit II, cyanide insensitive [Neoroseomonas lacus]